MRLVTLDWIIVLATILICFVPALFFGKRAGKSTSEFFASGRAVPWWLAGLSMVATTFSSDTPNDFYRRFLKPNRTEKHYVWVGRLATVLLFLAAALVTAKLDTAQKSFGLILQVGAGTGLLYLVRWFWWRVNAWCEIVAMLSSFIVSVVLFILNKNGANIPGDHALLITVATTTVCWVATAFLGPQ